MGGEGAEGWLRLLSGVEVESDGRLMDATLGVERVVFAA